MLAVAAVWRYRAAAGRACLSTEALTRDADALGVTVGRLRREIDVAVLDAGDGGGPDGPAPHQVGGFMTGTGGSCDEFPGRCAVSWPVSTR